MLVLKSYQNIAPRPVNEGFDHSRLTQEIRMNFSVNRFILQVPILTASPY